MVYRNMLTAFSFSLILRLQLDQRCSNERAFCLTHPGPPQPIAHDRAQLGMDWYGQLVFTQSWSFAATRRRVNLGLNPPEVDKSAGFPVPAEVRGTCNPFIF